jgi:cysteine synthase
VKDRIAISMVEAAERDGIISPGRTTLVGHNHERAAQATVS